jgi:hypothetical protein
MQSKSTQKQIILGVVAAVCVVIACIVLAGEIRSIIPAKVTGPPPNSDVYKYMPKQSLTPKQGHEKQASPVKPADSHSKEAAPAQH